MTVLNMNKIRLVSKGYIDLPRDGKRFRYFIERYRHDDGSEWGSIVDVQEIADVGEYLIIPSWGATEEAEAEYLREEYEYEQGHPDPLKTEWWAQHRANMKRARALYDEARDERAKQVKKSQQIRGGR